MAAFEVFSAAMGPYGNALLNWRASAPDQLLEYAASYRRAAMCLVASEQWREHGDIGSNALPIVFLYRHAFELHLKAVARHAALDTARERDLAVALPRLWREHSLVRLVDLCQPTFNRFGREDLWREAACVVERLDKIDPGSYSFRYPLTSTGDASLPRNLLMNVFVFSEAIEPLLDGLTELHQLAEGDAKAHTSQMKLPI